MRNSDRNIHLEFCSLQKVINNSQQACRFVGCSLEKNTDNSKETVRVKRTPYSVYRSLLHFLFKTADLNTFPLVGVNEGQAKTFLRQITGRQLWPTEINS